MSTFKTASYSLRDLIVSNLPDYTNDTALVGAIDIAYLNAMEITTENPKFCVINHHGGYADTSSITFTGTIVWRHEIAVAFYIPITAPDAWQEHEDELLDNYDLFLSTVGKNPRCIGNNTRLTVVRAYVPVQYDIRNQHYTELRYRVEVLQHL